MKDYSLRKVPVSLIQRGPKLQNRKGTQLYGEKKPNHGRGKNSPASKSTNQNRKLEEIAANIGASKVNGSGIDFQVGSFLSHRF